MTDLWSGSTAPTTIPVKVNGEVVGSEPVSATLASIAAKYSQSHGLKTFSVYVNDAKADTSQGASTLAQLKASSIELVAKEARG